MDRDRYDTLLLHGDVGPGEESLEELVRSMGGRLETVPSLQPELSPYHDARALVHLIQAVRRMRPHIVDTHTAKAGMLGRLAAVLAGGPRPAVVHTYHGHVLEGYFGPVRNTFYRGLERGLARVSDRLICPSSAVVDDLVRLRVADPSKFRVIPYGLRLDRFLDPPGGAREEFRQEAGVGASEVLLTYVGRLAQIKRIDRMLRAVARARALGAPVRLALVGDGDLRAGLEQQARDLGIADHVWFAGYRMDVAPAAAGSDIGLISSDNEGTPVSLIEAAAAATPLVATDVGGNRDVVTPDTGFLVPASDVEGLARSIASLAQDPGLRAQLGGQAREHVRTRYSVGRLIDDMDLLYRELIAEKRVMVEPDRSPSTGQTTSRLV